MFFVDDDDAEFVHRREHRRTRTDGDARRTSGHALPFDEALPLGQAGVQHGNLIAKTRSEARSELWRQRNFRNQHDGALPALESFGDKMQVDFCLAASGDSVE